jgi:hypothetical protein
VTVICDVPKPAGACTVTAADPDLVGSAAAVAVTVTDAGFGTDAGAVYNPPASTVPFPLPGATDQVTV